MLSEISQRKANMACYSLWCNLKKKKKSLIGTDEKSCRQGLGVGEIGERVHTFSYKVNKS